MCHSGQSFLRCAWEKVEGYYPKDKRVVSFSDRDFQLRVNYFFDVGVLDYSLAFIRGGSSVDAGLNS
jgi:hypothetical protein